MEQRISIDNGHQQTSMIINNNQSTKHQSPEAQRIDGSQKSVSQQMNSKQAELRMIQTHHWQAVYIDGSFYITDPSSIERLKQLQEQIVCERKKLDTLHQNHQIINNNSYYSLQEDFRSDPKVKSQNSHDCITQFNDSLLMERKNKAENDLIHEEDNYRQRIQKMTRERSEIKKEMHPTFQNIHQQANQSPLVISKSQDQGKRSDQPLVFNPVTTPKQISNKSHSKSNKQSEKKEYVIAIGESQYHSVKKVSNSKTSMKKPSQQSQNLDSHRSQIDASGRKERSKADSDRQHQVTVTKKSNSKRGVLADSQHPVTSQKSAKSQNKSLKSQGSSMLIENQSSLKQQNVQQINKGIIEELQKDQHINKSDLKSQGKSQRKSEARPQISRVGKSSQENEKSINRHSQKTEQRGLTEIKPEQAGNQKLGKQLQQTSIKDKSAKEIEKRSQKSSFSEKKQDRAKSRDPSERSVEKSKKKQSQHSSFTKKQESITKRHLLDNINQLQLKNQDTQYFKQPQTDQINHQTKSVVSTPMAEHKHQEREDKKSKTSKSNKSHIQHYYKNQHQKEQTPSETKKLNIQSNAQILHYMKSEDKSVKEKSQLRAQGQSFAANDELKAKQISIKSKVPSSKKQQHIQQSQIHEDQDKSKRSQKTPKVHICHIKQAQNDKQVLAQASDKEKSVKSKSRFSQKRQASKHQILPNDPQKVLTNSQKSHNSKSQGVQKVTSIREPHEELQRSAKTSSKKQTSYIESKKHIQQQEQPTLSENFQQIQKSHHKQQENNSSDRQSHMVKQNNNEFKMNKLGQSMISSIPANDYLHTKADALMENRSVQWSERPEFVINNKQHPSFHKSQKVDQAPEASETSKKKSQSKHKAHKNKAQQSVNVNEPSLSSNEDRKANMPQTYQIQHSRRNSEQNREKKKSIDIGFLKKIKKDQTEHNKSQLHNRNQMNKEITNRSLVANHQRSEQEVLANPKSDRSSEKRKSSAKKSIHSYIQKKSNHKQDQKKVERQQKLLKDDSGAKVQIQSLNIQVKMLQEKLKKVEQRQDNIQKLQRSQSKINQNSNKQQLESSPSEPPMSPLHNLKAVNNRLRAQKRLNLSSSIAEYNSVEDKKKKEAEYDQKDEKQKLREEIANLKKIIRDMQMDKIRSIDHDRDTLTNNSIKHKRDIRNDTYLSLKENNSQLLQKWKESLSSNDVGSAQQLQWNSDILKLRQPEQMGKIVKNSPQRANHDDSPRQKPYKMRLTHSLQRKSSERSEQIHLDNQIDLKSIPLKKFQSMSPSPRKRIINPQYVRQEILDRLEASERNFQKFMQFNKNINDNESNFEQLPHGTRKPENGVLEVAKSQKMEIPAFSQLRQESFKEHQSMLVKKKNFEGVLRRFKDNSQEINQSLSQLSLPEQIKFSAWEMPVLPQTPNQQMTHQQLLELAKETYSLFDINVDEYQSQLCMKKYKNCVIFTFSLSSQIILWHYSGKFYIGSWKSNPSVAGEGQKDGYGIEFVPQKHAYKGQFLNGKKNGNGLIMSDNGNVYQGQWIEGVKNGRGKYYEASTGTTYHGQWRDGKKDGFGVLRFSQKQYYQGTFAKSIKHGYGTQQFVNGDLYKGEYSNGRFNGKGMYLWANSSCYEGDFIDGFRHGQGTWKSSSQNGDTYTGQYVSDKKCGYGRYVWINGCSYEGYFKNDLKQILIYYRHGKGRLIYPDGKEVKGTWDQGTLVATNHQRKQFSQEDQPLRKSLKLSSIRVDPKISKFKIFDN